MMKAKIFRFYLTFSGYLWVFLAFPKNLSKIAEQIHQWHQPQGGPFWVKAAVLPRKLQEILWLTMVGYGWLCLMADSPWEWSVGLSPSGTKSCLFSVIPDQIAIGKLDFGSTACWQIHGMTDCPLTFLLGRKCPLGQSLDGRCTLLLSTWIFIWSQSWAWAVFFLLLDFFCFLGLLRASFVVIVSAWLGHFQLFLSFFSPANLHCCKQLFQACCISHWQFLHFPARFLQHEVATGCHRTAIAPEIFGDLPRSKMCGFYTFPGHNFIWWESFQSTSHNFIIN